MGRLRDPERHRLHQVARWLQARWPVDPVPRLRVVKKMPNWAEGDWAALDFNTHIVYVHEGPSLAILIEVLIHEWAHGVSGYPWKGQDKDCGLSATEHPPGFWALVGAMTNEWHDGGSGESLDY